ncbi:hypothetical protein MRY87_02780 [bacterium]|nr:hypothetical protein [bacterium]
MKEERFFSGEERIEFSQFMGRPFRMGEPEALLVGDIERLEQSIAEQDREKFQSYLTSLHPVYELIVGTFFEWSLTLPYQLSLLDGEEHEVESYVCATNDHFSEAIALVSRNYYLPSTIPHALKIFHENYPSAKTVLEVRAERDKGNSTDVDRYLRPMRELFTELTKSVESEEWDTAGKVLEQYVHCTRSLHDLMGHYVSVFGSVVARNRDDSTCVALLQQGLESCAVFEHLWTAVENFPPSARAAMLAEHLRHHFSGPGRKGSVRIEEDDKTYRLIFEPCGTGGAMRREQLPWLHIINEACPETWGISRQVNSYCAHCAQNEITSMGKLGYPAWVTEYKPDAKAPCGWTIYKDPNDIPEEYFTRIGFKKDPTLFKQTPP